MLEAHPTRKLVRGKHQRNSARRHHNGQGNRYHKKDSKRLKKERKGKGLAIHWSLRVGSFVPFVEYNIPLTVYTRKSFLLRHFQYLDLPFLRVSNRPDS